MFILAILCIIYICITQVHVLACTKYECLYIMCNFRSPIQHIQMYTKYSELPDSNYRYYHDYSCNIPFTRNVILFLLSPKYFHYRLWLSAVPTQAWTARVASRLAPMWQPPPLSPWRPCSPAPCVVACPLLARLTRLQPRAGGTVRRPPRQGTSCVSRLR